MSGNASSAAGSHSQEPEKLERGRQEEQDKATLQEMERIASENWELGEKAGLAELQDEDDEDLTELSIQWEKSPEEQIEQLDNLAWNLTVTLGVLMLQEAKHLQKSNLDPAQLQIQLQKRWHTFADPQQIDLPESSDARSKSALTFLKEAFLTEHKTTVTGKFLQDRWPQFLSQLQEPLTREALKISQRPSEDTSSVAATDLVDPPDTQPHEDAHWIDTIMDAGSPLFEKIKKHPILAIGLAGLAIWGAIELAKGIKEKEKSGTILGGGILAAISIFLLVKTGDREGFKNWVNEHGKKLKGLLSMQWLASLGVPQSWIDKLDFLKNPQEKLKSIFEKKKQDIISRITHNQHIPKDFADGIAKFIEEDISFERFSTFATASGLVLGATTVGLIFSKYFRANILRIVTLPLRAPLKLLRGASSLALRNPMLTVFAAVAAAFGWTQRDKIEEMWNEIKDKITWENISEAVEVAADKTMNFLGFKGAETIDYENREPMIALLERLRAVVELKEFDEYDVRKDMQEELICVIDAIIVKLQTLKETEKYKLDFRPLSYLATRIELFTESKKIGDGTNVHYTFAIEDIEFPLLGENPEAHDLETIRMGITYKLIEYHKIFEYYGCLTGKEAEKFENWFQETFSKKNVDELLSKYGEKFQQYALPLSVGIVCLALFTKFLRSNIKVGAMAKWASIIGIVFFGGEAAAYGLGEVVNKQKIENFKGAMGEIWRDTSSYLPKSEISDADKEFLEELIPVDIGEFFNQFGFEIPDMAQNLEDAGHIEQQLNTLLLQSGGNENMQKAIQKLQQQIAEGKKDKEAQHIPIYSGYFAEIAFWAKQAGMQITVTDSANGNFTLRIGAVEFTNLSKNPLGEEYRTSEEIRSIVTETILSSLKKLHDRIDSFVTPKFKEDDLNQYAAMARMLAFLDKDNEFRQRIARYGFFARDLDILIREAKAANIIYEQEDQAMYFTLPNKQRIFLGIHPDCPLEKFETALELRQQWWASAATGIGEGAHDILVDTAADTFNFRRLLHIAPKDSELEHILVQFLVDPALQNDPIWVARFLKELVFTKGISISLAMDGITIYGSLSANIAWNGIRDTLSAAFIALMAPFTDHTFEEALHEAGGSIILFGAPLVGSVVGLGVGGLAGGRWRQGARIGWKAGQKFTWGSYKLLRSPLFLNRVSQNPMEWVRLRARSMGHPLYLLRNLPGARELRRLRNKGAGGIMQVLRNPSQARELLRSQGKRGTKLWQQLRVRTLFSEYVRLEQIKAFWQNQQGANRSHLTGYEKKINNILERQKEIIKRLGRLRYNEAEGSKAEGVLQRLAGRDANVRKYRQMNPKDLPGRVWDAAKEGSQKAKVIPKESVRLAGRVWEAKTEAGMKVLAMYQLVMGVRSVVEIENAKGEIEQQKKNTEAMNISAEEKRQMITALDETLAMLRWQELIVSGNITGGTMVLSPELVRLLQKTVQDSEKLAKALPAIQRAAVFANKLGKWGGPLLIATTFIELGFYNLYEIPHLRESIKEMKETIPMLVENGFITQEQGIESMQLLKDQLALTGEKQLIGNLERGIAILTLFSGGTLGLAALAAMGPYAYMYHTAEKTRDREITTIQQWLQMPKDVLINELLATAADQNASEAYRLSTSYEEIEFSREKVRKRLIEAICIKAGDSVEKVTLRRNYFRLCTGATYYLSDFSAVQRLLDQSNTFADAVEAVDSLSMDFLRLQALRKQNAPDGKAWELLADMTTRRSIIARLKADQVEGLLKDYSESELLGFVLALNSAYKKLAPQATPPLTEKQFENDLHAELYSLAIHVGYPEEADYSLEALHIFYNEGQKENRGIYWDNGNWYVNRAGFSRDYNVGNDEKTLEKIRSYLQEHRLDILKPSMEGLTDLRTTMAQEALATKVDAMVELLSKGRSGSEKLAA